MNPPVFHISLYYLGLLASIFVGLTFALLLWFTPTARQSANRFLALPLLLMIFALAHVLTTGRLLPPLTFAFGPLIYLYTLQVTQPSYSLRRKDFLHFLPLLLEPIVLLRPLLPVLVFISVLAYLYHSRRLIERFYQAQKMSGGDRSRIAFRWLDKPLLAAGILCLLLVPLRAVDYFFYHDQGNPNFYYLFYASLSALLIWIAARAHSMGQVVEPADKAAAPVTPIPDELRQKGQRLRSAMLDKRYYQDAELTLASLAAQLSMSSHELSRVINTVCRKSFHDFVSEYRVKEIIQKMQDPAFDRITLLGIAYEAGFNSKSSFNRIFKEMTGKSPAAYKISLKKEFPTYKPGRPARFTALHSVHRPLWSGQQLNRLFMFRNYLKMAWRTMLHNKVYSILNITGLAAGMAVALVIGFWIYSQYAYDRFLPGYDRLYQVKLNFFHSGEVHTQSGSSLPLVDALRNNYPEVQYASETDWGGQHSLVNGDKKLDPYGLSVGTDFLKMFPYPMLTGNPASVFADPNSIVLTESLAVALFGTEAPIGKTLRIDNRNEVRVTGVLKDIPHQSTLQFRYLLPYSYLEQTYPASRKERLNWENTSFLEYVQLKPGTDGMAFETKIKDIIAAHIPDKTTKIEVILQPAKNWRLLNQFRNGKASDGLIGYVRIFGIIGLLVLVIACINFVNLATARAEKRAREVGVRKSIGSSRPDLIVQFLSESLLLTLAAFVLSIGSVQLVLPWFNTTTNSTIAIPYSSIGFWGLMLGYVLLTGLLAGSRPAFYLSSFEPAKVLKGSFQAGKAASLPRKILVVVQFTCSVALIISTLVIYQQINHARNRPKGYDAENLVMVGSSDDLNKNYELLKHDLLQSGQVVSVTKSGSNMMYFPASFSIKDFPGKKAGESLEMATTAISSGYFNTIGMKFIAGHDYAATEGEDSMNIIINQAAAERLRLKAPLDQLISLDYRAHPMRIIGVVENAVVGSPFYAAGPALYVYNPGWNGAVMFRLNANAAKQQALKNIATVFNQYNPSFPFDYRFADDAYHSSYQLEALVGSLARIFAVLAIFISCIGLFGLASFVAEQRKKEIGIRKVMGASVSQVWLLLSKDFLVLVVISCVIASPVALYFLQGWLQQFDYRITIGPLVFLIAAVLTLFITLVTISYQAISSALTNPVKSLRSE